MEETFYSTSYQYCHKMFNISHWSFLKSFAGINFHDRLFNFNPIQDGHFRDCSRMGWGQKGPTSLKSVTNIVQWWNLAAIPYLKKIQKVYESRGTPLNSADISIFHRKSANFVIARNTDKDWILIHNFPFS